jgi:two-component system invasion response regulator UvrY
VVDDSEIFERVGASLVSEAQGLHLVGVAASGEEAIRLLPELEPDLVLLDIHMPGIGGLEAAREIQRESPKTVVVLVTADPGSVAIDPRSVGAADLLSKVELSPRQAREALPRAPAPRLGGFGGRPLVAGGRWSFADKDAGSLNRGAIRATEDAAQRASSVRRRPSLSFAKPSY